MAGPIRRYGKKREEKNDLPGARCCTLSIAGSSLYLLEVVVNAWRIVLLHVDTVAPAVRFVDNVLVAFLGVVHVIHPNGHHGARQRYHVLCLIDLMAALCAAAQYLPGEIFGASKCFQSKKNWPH